jgi:isopenicillin-N N-acyltransferase-like protein
LLFQEKAMSRAHPHIPVVEASGAPGQLGAAHGEAQRDRIRAFAEEFIGYIVRNAAVPLTEDKLWSLWAPQVAANQREAPALVEEMHGIARGAAVSFERVFLINSMLDVNSFRYLEMATCFAGCTTFAVAREHGTGRSLLGQTYDMPEFFQKYLTVLRLRPAGGPRQLLFTFAGIVGAAGLNESGVAVNINYLSPRDLGPGRLHAVIVRQILAGRLIADALTPALLAPRAGGAHYLVADRDGTLVSIETTAHRHHIFYPEGNTIGHTNHYLADELRDTEYIRAPSIGSSVARYASLRRFFRDRGDGLTLQGLQELTRNHTSYPRSICAHGADWEPAGQKGRTVSAMILIPAEGMMHLTAGCACENDYHPVALGENI